MVFATENPNSLLKKVIKVASVFIAAAFATGLLFTLMLALIATSFEPRKEKRKSIEFVAVDTEEIITEVTLKLRDKDKSLLKKVELPPTTETKSAPRASKPQTNTASFVSKVTFSDISPNLEISAIRPFLGQSGSSADHGGVGTARSRAGGAQAAGANHCTLIAHIGPTTSDIKEIEFMDCRSGRIAELAEIELYKWINGRAKSYVDLGAQVGDAVEFTYEEKRRVN